MGNQNLLHLAKFTYHELYQERAAIKEFDGGMDRGQAEEEALDEVAKEFAAIGQGATEDIFRAAIFSKGLT